MIAILGAVAGIIICLVGLVFSMRSMGRTTLAICEQIRK